VRPALRRRSLLGARQALSTAIAQRDQKSEEVTVLRGVLAKVQEEADAFCAGPGLGGSTTPLAALTPLRTNGFYADPALRWSDFVDQGRGVVAAEAISAGTEVLRVPRACLLNVYTALTSQTFGPTARALMMAGLHEETIAMLFAVAERRRCQGIKLPEGGDYDVPWADLLLRNPGLERVQELLAWPIEAVEALGAEQICAVFKENLASLWKLSHEVVAVVRELPQEAARGLGGPIGFDDLLWARCLFDSRAVAAEVPVPAELRAAAGGPEAPAAVEGQQWLALRDSAGAHKAWAACSARVVCLVPIVEMLNHSARGACLAPTFDKERQALVVATAAGVPAGSELCLCYGALQNWELLMYYGFCPDENPHDRLTLSIDLPEDMEDASAAVLLRLHAVPTDHALRPSAGSEEPVQGAVGSWDLLGVLPPQLLRCLRLLLSEDAGFVDVDAPPGIPELLELDVRCLATAEDLLKGLQASFEPVLADPRPLWWYQYGAPVMKYRASQHALVAASVRAAEVARARLEAAHAAVS